MLVRTHRRSGNHVPVLLMERWRGVSAKFGVATHTANAATCYKQGELTMNNRKFGLAAALLIMGGACVAPREELPPDEDLGISEDAIVNGYAATWSLFDPVGALVQAEEGGTYRSFCTATLVAPTLVVTAKHCTGYGRMDEPVYFAIGFDSAQPDRLVQINKFLWERTVSDSITNLGADAGIGFLAEAITDVPLVSLVPADTFHHVPYWGGLILPSLMLPVGFGLQEFNPPFQPTDPNTPFGTRFLGISKVAAIEGDNYWPAVYGASNFAEFRGDVINGDNLTEPLTQAQEDNILDDWNNELTLGASDLVTVSPTVTHPGDSGGPILRLKHGGLATHGIVSGAIFSSGDDDHTILRRAAIYTAYTPEVLHFVDSAKACGTVPTRGECNGNTIERCTGIDQGPPQVATEVCADTCAETPDGAACLPACASDADCIAEAPGGVCSANVCNWAPVNQCLGEPGGFSCLLCCLNHKDGPTAFGECFGVCFPPPSQSSTSNSGGASMLINTPNHGEISVPIQP